jgi:transcription antitermination factor NusG
MAVPHYCPLVRRRTCSPGGRVRTSFVPLFSSYVFVLANEGQRTRALSTNCISRCLPVPNGKQLAHDLHQIRRLVLADAPLTPEARIAPGNRVRIRSGSLCGLEGTVIKRRGSERLLVVVAFLQKGASVQLDDFQVERID